MRHAQPRTGRRVKRLPLVATPALLAAALAAFALRPHDAGLTVTADQRTIIDRLESVLLHDTVVPQYGRVVDQFDARGYVAGIGDFSTAGGEAFEVVQRYTASVGSNVLGRAYLSTLAALTDKHSADVGGLAGFPTAWRAISDDPGFRQTQNDVLRARYFRPALDLANSFGIQTPLGLAIVYDSILQHGGGTDADGLPALVNRARAQAGGTPRRVGEQIWLKAFLDVRRQVLATPAQPAHQQVWPYATGRVDTLAALLAGQHDQLTPPLLVDPYGTQHVLDLYPIDEPPPSQSAAPTPPATATISPTPSVHPVASPATTVAPHPPTRAPIATPAGTPPAVARQGPVIGIAGLCLDVDGGVSMAGNHVQIYTCNGTDAQLWTAGVDGTLRAVGMCAQVRGDSVAPTSQVEIDPCDGRASQQWRFTGGELVNVPSGLCLTVPGDTTKLSAFVLVANCTGSAGQRWSPPGLG